MFNWAINFFLNAILYASIYGILVKSLNKNFNPLTTMRKQEINNKFDYEDHESGVRFDWWVPDDDKIRVRFWLIFQGKVFN